MFDSIIFNLNRYFGYSSTFVYFSLHPVWICYAARCVHFTVPSGTWGSLFFLWEQMYTSGSTFIKKIKPFICHYISMPRKYIKIQDCKTNCFIIAPPSVDFYNYWWIGPILSITSSNIYTKRINSTTQTMNSTVLWWLLWYQVILYHPNIFAISIDVSKQSFPN